MDILKRSINVFSILTRRARLRDAHLASQGRGVTAKESPGGADQSSAGRRAERRDGAQRQGREGARNPERRRDDGGPAGRPAEGETDEADAAEELANAGDGTAGAAAAGDRASVTHVLAVRVC